MTITAYRVVTEPRNVSFIASVEEDGAPVIVPKLIGHEVALLECQAVVKPKVIHLHTITALMQDCVCVGFYTLAVTQDCMCV